MKLFLFSPDTPVGRFMTLVWRIILLDLLFVVSVLPVVTLGAAISAVSQTALHLRRGGDEAAKTYLLAFRRNWKQATGLFFLLAGISAFLAFDLYIIAHSTFSFRTYLVSVYALLVFLAALVMVWVLPLSGQFENSVRGTLKNAVTLAFSHFFRSIGMLILSVFPYIFFILFPDAFVSAGLFMFLFYFGIAAYLCAAMIDPVFLSLMTEEERERALRNAEEAEEERGGRP